MRFRKGDLVILKKNIAVGEEIIEKGSLGEVSFTGEYPIWTCSNVEFGWCNVQVDHDDLFKLGQ